MSCLLQTQPDLRTTAMNPGRVVKICRGGSWIWKGKLAEPQPSPDGWAISAAGTGTLGTNYASHYTSWTADNPVNLAIARGLPWVNPGLAGIAGLWLSQQEDDASQTITDFLNLLCTNGALTWYVDAHDVLRIIPIPVTPTRLLIASDPVARTVTADINTLWLRYQATADATSQTSGSSTAAATYSTVSATNPASIAAHQAMESYQDLSSAGVMSAAAAQAAGQSVLAAYVRATYAGPFTIRQGQLLTLGGYPADIGAERGIPGVCQLLLSDFGFGGELVQGPITFPVGTYEYDDTAQTAAVTPFASIASDLSSLLAAMFPASPAGAGSQG